MKDKHVFWLLLVFIVFMHFEGFIKLIFQYHPIAHGFKYVFAFLFFAIMIFRTGVAKTPLNAPLFLFSFIVLLQFLNPLTFGKGGFVLSAIGTLYYLAFAPLFFVAYSMMNVERLKKVFYLILGLSTLSAIASYIQFYIGWPQYAKLFGYSESVMPRILGAAAHGPLAFDVVPPAFWYASAIGIGLTLLLHLNRKKLLLLALILNQGLALLLSTIRIAIMATLLMISVILALGFESVKRRLKLCNAIRLLFILLMLFIVVFPHLSWRTQEVYLKSLNPLEAYAKERGFTWILLATNTLKYPLGVGLRAGGLVKPESFGVNPTPIYMGDNYLLIFAGELGFFGLIALFWIYLTIIKRFYSNYVWLRGEIRHINIGLFAILFSFMVVVGFVAGSTPSYWLFWLFSGMLFKLQDLEAPHTQFMESREEGFIRRVAKHSGLMKRLLRMLQERWQSQKLLDQSLAGKAVKQAFLFVKSSRAFRFVKRLFE